MQAIVYSRKDREGISIATKPRPTSVPSDSLLCEVMCVGLNPVDAKFLLGDKLPQWCRGLGRSYVEGRTVGFDFAGRVVECPGNDNRFKPGDAVFGTAPPGVGTLSDFIIVPKNQVAHKPTSLSFAEAGALPLVGLTALQALKHDHHLSEGQHLILIGASGGVGHVAIQVAKALGANVTAICSERNRALVTELGADRVIDYTKGPEALLASLRDTVERYGQFDLCFDTVTSAEEKDSKCGYMDLLLHPVPLPGTSTPAQPLLRGKYITIGGPLMDWVRAGLKRVTGISLFGTHDHFWIRFPNSADALAELSALADGGKLRPRVAEEVPMTADDVRDAFARLHGRRLVGKSVVRVRPDPPAGAGAAGTGPAAPAAAKEEEEDMRDDEAERPPAGGR